ncbi:MAG: DUF3785 family protein [Peptostreptococcaceae bacterium]
MKFMYKEKEYNLIKENLIDFYNDEEKEVSGIDEDKILTLLKKLEFIDFEEQYYQEACGECLNGVKEKQKFFEFLEYHFYIYTKNGEYIISDISKEYEGLSFNKLLRKKEVDDSYIVSVMVCSNCSKFVLQIDNCVV